MRWRRIGVVVAAATMASATAIAGLAPSGSVAAGPLDQRIDRSIDVGGLACVHVAAHLSLEAPMEAALQQASIQPAPCR